MSVEKKEPSKVPLMMEDGLDMEMKPADARKYLDKGFQLLLEIAENSSDTHFKLDALRGVSQYYSMIIMKDGLDESVSKMARTQDRTLDEVKRLRRKPWDETDTENGEE
jgi:hypothetical protein